MSGTWRSPRSLLTRFRASAITTIEISHMTTATGTDRNPSGMCIGLGAYSMFYLLFSFVCAAHAAQRPWMYR